MRYGRALVVVGIAAALLTILGAFGTGTMPLGPRIAYWLVVMGTGALLGIGASAAVRSWGGLSDRRLLEGALISTTIAVPLTLTVGAMNVAFLGGPMPTLVSGLVLFGSVLAVTAAIISVNYTRALPRSAQGSQDKDASGASARPAAAEAGSAAKFARPTPAALMGRLPAHLRGARLQAIQAEDHYLRVHTDEGEALILLRLSDALREIAEVEGAQTHRSWWVARSAVTSIRRMDGRAEIALRSGATVPVSRAQLRTLIGLGWLD